MSVPSSDLATPAVVASTPAVVASTPALTSVLPQADLLNIIAAAQNLVATVDPSASQLLSNPDILSLYSQVVSNIGSTSKFSVNSWPTTIACIYKVLKSLKASVSSGSSGTPFPITELQESQLIMFILAQILIQLNTPASQMTTILATSSSIITLLIDVQEGVYDIVQATGGCKVCSSFFACGSK